MNGQKSDLNIQRPLILLREEEFLHLQNSFFNEFFPKSQKDPASTDLIDKDNAFFDFGKNSLKKLSNRDIWEFFLSQQKQGTLNIKIAEYSKLKELLIAENSELESTEADNDEKRPRFQEATAARLSR